MKMIMKIAAVPEEKIIKLMDDLAADPDIRLVAPVRENGKLVFREINGTIYKDTHNKDTHNKDTHNKDIHDKDTHNKDTHDKDTGGKDSNRVDIYKKDSINAVLNDEITYKSPKEFFFPQVEKLLEFDNNGSVSIEHISQQTFIIGIRPCDLSALKVMTAVFTEGRFIDTYFVEHLENTIIAGLGCCNEKPGCFCAERGIDKANSEDCDLFFNKCGDKYSINVNTEKGIRFINKVGIITNPIDTPVNSVPNQAISSILDSNNDSSKEPPAGTPSHIPMNTQKGSLADTQTNIQMTTNAGLPTDTPIGSPDNTSVDKKLLEINADENDLFTKVDWERLTEKCLGCGTCTYICPTCHCFEFKDVVENGCTSRYRYWDSCMYPRFTLHASGHNPRTLKKDRYRQRIMHKYLYVRKNFGYIACTGCGRCIRSCPAGMNIKSVVKEILEEIK